MPECTIYEYIWNKNKDYLGSISLQYFGEKISFRSLFNNIDRAASAFSSIGVKRGDIVTMVTVTTPEIVYSLYGLNRIGAIANMIDPRTSEEGIRDYIVEVHCKFILIMDIVYPKVQKAISDLNLKKVILVSLLDSMPAFKKIPALLLARIRRVSKNDRNVYHWGSFIAAGAGSLFPRIPYQKNRCCVIVHTGGTTGIPKGVMLSDDCLNTAVFQGNCGRLGFKRGLKSLGIMPPFIAYGIINNLHYSLSISATLIIVPLFDASVFDKLLLRYKPNIIAGVPSHYGSIVKSGRLKNKDLSFLSYPCVGGDGMKKEYETKINTFLKEHSCPTNIIKGYGMTEICAAVCQTAQMEYNKLGSVGIPLSHSVVSIFDPETTEELSYNSLGEVCMRGPHIMLGYYNNDVETSKVLRIHKDGFVWLHSGDMGYMDEDGCLYIQGRIKSMIIRADGFKVFPSMIEQVISSSNDLIACAVIGIRDKDHVQGQYPVAFVVKKPTCSKTDKALTMSLQDLCRSELPEYAMPATFYVTKELPLTPIGKIDYLALEKQANEQRGDS